MEPPAKVTKLSLSEAANVFHRHNCDVDPTCRSSGTASVSQNQKDEVINPTADFSQEEEEENTQIQASLPLYFDHVFGTSIGHSQSQMATPHVASQPSSLLKQCSFGFSFTDARLLDSQGFIFNSSSGRGSPVSIPSSLSSLQLHKCQQSAPKSPTAIPNVSAPAPVSPSVSTMSSPSPIASPSRVMSSPALFISSPSSVSSSPSARSNRSGTPILFPSPPTPSPPSKASPDLLSSKNTNTSFQQSCGSNKTVLSDSVSCHQEKGSRGGEYLIDELTKGSEERLVHRPTSRGKRKLNFDSIRCCQVGYSCPPSCTLLSECSHAHKTVSIFAIVLQVNPVMDVACKTGSKAGYTVPMSSLLLGDPTKSYFKLSLWREAAAWAERISAGDVILFKNIKLRIWQREIVGTTIMYSSVLNLHQPKKQLPDKVKSLIPRGSLESLLEWGRRSYGYLFGGSSSLQPKSQKTVNFSSSTDLGKETLIHFRAKVLSLISSRVLLVADEPGAELQLYLLCVDASVWHSQLSGGVGQVWEFMFIAVTLDGATQGGGYSLQTTSSSFLRQLQEDCQQAREVLAKFPGGAAGHVTRLDLKQCTIADLTSASVSGIVEVKARALTAMFLLGDGSRLDVSQLLQAGSEKVVSQLCQALYVGCESCSKPLEQDSNGVYCQCLSCMLRRPGGYPSSSFYFRPMVLALQDSTGIVCISVNHAVIPKVLRVRSSEIVKANLAQSEMQFDSISKAVMSSWQLLNGCVAEQESKDLDSTYTRWIVNCTISKDENSFIEAVCISLVDID